MDCAGWPACNRVYNATCLEQKFDVVQLIGGGLKVSLTRYQHLQSPECESMTSRFSIIPCVPIGPENTTSFDLRSRTHPFWLRIEHRSFAHLDGVVLWKLVAQAPVEV